MHLTSLFNYYRVGRFVFALALLISLQIAGLPFAAPNLMFVISVYSFIALLGLIFLPKINYFDFLLDIVFISAIIHAGIGDYSYLTLLYLFPIFFASVLIKTKKIFVFPIISALLYGIIYYANISLYSGTFYAEGILNISLHLLSFSLIALAGDNLKERMENQERHIKYLEDERIKIQGYERLYRVSADLAHELRNPLSSISAAVQFLKEGKNDKEFIDMLDTETKRLTNLVNDFLLFSRPADAPKEEVNLSETLTSLISHYRIEESSNKKITFHATSNASIIANRTFLEIALSNIIKNAIEAAASEVRVSLKIKSHKSMVNSQVSEKNLNANQCIIEIEDNGTGVDENIKDKIFEPFFTTKKSGTGLGLAIAYRIITGFGGNIFVDRSSFGGARFTIMF